MANYEGGSVELKILSTADQAAQAINRLMAAVRGVRGEIASFDKTFDNVSKSVNRLANGMKVIEKLNLNKVNVQIAGVSSALGSMSANLTKVDLSGFSGQSDTAAQSLNRLTNSFRQLEKLKNIDTKQAYRDLDRLGRISSAGLEKMADALKGVDLSQIQSAGSAINTLVNGLYKIQNLKLDTNITGNLKSQLDALAPTLNEFINKLSGINADGLKEVAKAFRDLPKSMERMQALDLSRLGTVFDTLATQITPFLVKLKEASAELQAFASISKNLSGTTLKIPGIPTGGVSGGLGIMSNVFAGARTGMSSFTSGLGKIGSGLTNLIKLSDKTSKSFLGMLNVGKLYFLVNYTKRMTQSFGQMLKSAIDFIEVENLFSRAMGTARAEAYRFSNTLSEAFGLALPDLMKAQGIFNNILKSLGGINDEMAQILSQSLTKMAVDFSALYNVSVESAIEKLEAALVGQTKPIRSVSGMDITMATLQTYLTQLGIVDRTVRQLSEVEKRLLRIYALQEQLKASRAMGAWAQEIENPANQLKILSEQMKEISRWISAVFVQAISKALPYINGFAMAIKELVKALAFAIGYELPFTENIPDLLDTAGAADGLGDVEDALKDVKNAATGIDELNILAPPEAAAAPTGIDPRLLEALGEYDNMMESVRMKALDIRDAILDWFKYIRSLSWEEIADYARGLGQQLADFLNNIVAGVDWYNIGSNVAHGINTLLNFLYGFMTTFNWGAIGNAFADGLNGMVDTVDWDLLGRTLASYWNALIDFLYEFVTNFEWVKFGISIGNSINSFFAEIDWEKAGKTLSDGFLGILSFLISLVETIDWKKIGENIRDFILAIDWNRIVDSIMTLIKDVISGVLTALWEVFKSLDPSVQFAIIFAGIVAVIANAASAIIPIIMTLSGVSTAFETTIGSLIATAAPVIGIITLIVGGLALLVTGIMQAVEGSKALETAMMIIGGIMAVAAGIAIAVGGWIPLAIGAIVAAIAMIVMYWEEVKSFFVNIGVAIADFFTKTIPAKFNEFVTWMGELPKRISEFLGLVVGNLAKFATQDIPKFITDVGNWFKKLPDKIWEGLKAALAKLTEWGKAALSWVSTEIPKIVKSVADFFTVTIPKKIGEFVDWIGKIPEKMLEIGKNIVQGLFDGILSFFTDIGEWIKTNISDPFVEGFEKAFGIASPSKVMAKLGDFTGQGFINGLSESTKNTDKIFVKIWQDIQNVFKDVNKWFSEKFTSAWKGIQEAFKDAIKYFQDIWKKIQDTFKDVKAWFSTKFTEAWNSIKTAFTPATDFFKNIWTNISNTFADVKNWFSSRFSDAWNSIKAAFNPMIEFFKNIWTNVSNTFFDVKNWFSTRFNDAWTSIKSAFTPASSFFSGIYDNIKSAFRDISSWFGNTFTNAWNAIKNAFNNVSSFFTSVKNSIVSIFSSVGTSVGTAISNAFKSVINSALSAVQSVVNSVISAINNVLTVLNKIPGVNISRISPISIPRFELGGFPDKGAFMYNEGSHAELLGNINGRTAVVNNEQIISAVSQGVAQAVASVLSSQQQRPPQPIQLTTKVMVNDREIARSTNKANIDMGTNQLSGGFVLA